MNVHKHKIVKYRRSELNTIIVFENGTIPFQAEKIFFFLIAPLKIHSPILREIIIRILKTNQNL